jgi:hypothetical protein
MIAVLKLPAMVANVQSKQLRCSHGGDPVPKAISGDTSSERRMLVGSQSLYHRQSPHVHHLKKRPALVSSNRISSGAINA